MCGITVENTGHYFLGVTFIRFMFFVINCFSKLQYCWSYLFLFAGIKGLIFQGALQSSDVTVELWRNSNKDGK